MGNHQVGTQCTASGTVRRNARLTLRTLEPTPFSQKGQGSNESGEPFGTRG